MDIGRAALDLNFAILDLSFDILDLVRGNVHEPLPVKIHHARDNGPKVVPKVNRILASGRAGAGLAEFCSRCAAVARVGRVDHPLVAHVALLSFFSRAAADS